MLENWAFDPSTLHHFAVDAAGKPMPGTLIDALRASDHFGRAMSARRQMFCIFAIDSNRGPFCMRGSCNRSEHCVGVPARTDAQISLQLHMRDPTVAGFDPAAIVAELEQEFSPYPAVPHTHFEANFGHLMGYSAIYYTYMWSQAIAQQVGPPSNSSRFCLAARAPARTACAWPL